MLTIAPASPALEGVAFGAREAHKPRLGFAGLGWIGLHRMQAIEESGVAQVAALADPGREVLAQAKALVPHAWSGTSFDALLDEDLDGIVIATPSALHADQARAALARGIAVYCQKPLARSAAECARVIDAARASDRLLGVDLCYRETDAMRCIRAIVAGGEIGDVYAIDLVFHNAYGPDKPWFRDARLSGGGCVIDLGIHLVDLALWTLGFPRVERVASRLFAGGRPLARVGATIEDHAIAQIDLADGVVARLACSWNLHAGRDAAIEATFHGTRGGASMRNVNGSFYDFVAERFDGTTTTLISQPPDAWGGRAAVQWARKLAAGAGYDPQVERIADVAAVLDAIYGR